MPKKPTQLKIEDPDNVPEILCHGKFNVYTTGDFATLTFTHIRPDPTDMLQEGVIKPRFVVRARIVVTLASLRELRDLLSKVTQSPNVPSTTSGDLVRH
jgi:hypothetical protein